MLKKIYTFLRKLKYYSMTHTLLGKSCTLKANERRIRKSSGPVRLLKNMYEGKRCFIIGNGPSLTPGDLEKIRGEISFGVNHIYEIFDRTDWRPTYYCAQDWKMIRNNRKDINKKLNCQKFIGLLMDEPYSPVQKPVQYLHLNTKRYTYPDFPDFSEHIEDQYYEGYTVTYMCMQMAAYMGFKEIYLLGVDHNYATMIDEKGNLIHNEDAKDHFSENDVIDSRHGNIPRLDQTTLAYKAAKRYADQNGIKIYNATRGGKLEVFERVNLEQVVEGNNKCY